MRTRTQRLAAVAALALIATPAAAQNVGDPAAYPATQEREDDDFPWGLLGLLGLAGLMGMKRKDRDDNDRSTGTGTTNR